MAYKKEQLTEAYFLAGINRDDFNDAQKRLFDKIIMLLISKCNQQDVPISSMAEAFQEIRTVMDEDPLFSRISFIPEKND